MNRKRPQFRIATLIWLTTAIGCGCGFYGFAGFQGVLVLLGVALVGLFALLGAVAYVRVMSYLFDVFIGPFLS